MNDWLRALASAAALSVGAELLFLALWKRVPQFRLRVLYHLWVAALAAVTALWVSDPALFGTFFGKTAATSALLLSALVLFSLVDALVLQRPWHSSRDPMMPKLGRDVLRLALLIAVGLLAATEILGQPVGAVLVSSTILSAVVGLALQDTLKNIFAGVSLDLEKPFRRGDWLMLDGETQVRVVDMSWRSTRLRTKEGVEIFEPNANLSVSRVFNYGSGDRPVGFLFNVGLPYGVPPSVAKRVLLGAAASAPETVQPPAVQVFVEGFDDHSIGYRLRVWTRAVADVARFRDEINSRIWYALKREGIEIPFPIRTLLMHEAPRIAEHQQRTAARKAFELFSTVDLFAALEEEAVRRLALAAERRLFDRGEVLFREGEAGDSLFLVEFGSVGVYKGDPGTREGRLELAQLAAGAFFGEMSLLTGEPRSATVIATDHTSVLVLAKESLAPLLEENPQIAESLSKALAIRSRTNLATSETRTGLQGAGSVAVDEKSLLKRIRTFFLLR
jgi:small-conductance mechanosensitive channel/CRP-like cAMP-binding protein